MKNREKERNWNNQLFRKLYSRLNIIHVHDPRKQDNPILTPTESIINSKSLTSKSIQAKKLRYDKTKRLKTQESKHLFTSHGIIAQKKKNTIFRTTLRQIDQQNSCLIGTNKIFATLDRKKRTEYNKTFSEFHSQVPVQERNQNNSAFSGRICSAHICRRKKAKAMQDRSKKRDEERKRKSEEKGQKFEGWIIEPEEGDLFFNS